MPALNVALTKKIVGETIILGIWDFRMTISTTMNSWNVNLEQVKAQRLSPKAYIGSGG
tara:strand:- start:116 stop:289 length:174 start_codon:yes stop_codon:yes gene_type:complete